MKKKSKKLMFLQYNFYKEIEQKLEKYAENGFILEKTGSVFWIFKNEEPKKLKYTVAYFKEGSIFNPFPTDNQLTYFEYAKESGWDFVCEYGQMQIFSSNAENPIPFETDQEEMFENIHTCMKKNFIPSQITLLVLWCFYIYLRINSFIQKPTDFLASTLDLTTLLVIFSATLFTFYNLLNYYQWYFKSKRSLSIGGGIVNTYNKTKKIIETIYIIGLFLLVGYMFISLFNKISYKIIILLLIPIPLLVFILRGMIVLLKKRKISAKINRIVVVIIYVLFVILYTAVVFYSISQFDFIEKTEKSYTTVEWEMGEHITKEYRLYQDELPLTCSDLYGEIYFDNYSYENNTEESIFLKKESYSQTAPPMKDSPPKVEYTIYTPKLNFIYNLITKELTTIDERFNIGIEELDNSLFGTKEAYTFFYNGSGKTNYQGEYLLLFEHKIIHLDTEEQMTNEEILVIKAKLLNE